jgi:hypothetical protein
MMNRERILQEAKAELERHIWGTFVEGNATVALGGTGVVVSGCEACRKRFGTNSQYLRHIAEDVLPGILENAFKNKASALWESRPKRVK